MKSVLMLVLLLGTQLTFAQSIKEKREKEEILTRVESLVTKITEARDALEIEDVVHACKKIDEVFKILPDHLMAIGTKMNLFDGKVIQMEQETKMHLIYIHQQSNICAVGETGENLQLKEVAQKLKSMSKALEKQRKKIKKLDTDFENTYNYYYEFH